MALVLEWAALHRQELRADWERARGGTPLESIAPLAGCGKMGIRFTRGAFGWFF